MVYVHRNDSFILHAYIRTGRQVSWVVTLLSVLCSHSKVVICLRDHLHRAPPCPGHAAMHYDALTRRFVSIATDTSGWGALGRGATAWFDGIGPVGYPRVFIGTLGLPYTYTLFLGTSYVYCELITWFMCIVMTASYCMLIYVRGAR